MVARPTFPQTYPLDESVYLRHLIGDDAEMIEAIAGHADAELQRYYFWENSAAINDGVHHSANDMQRGKDMHYLVMHRERDQERTIGGVSLASDSFNVGKGNYFLGYWLVEGMRRRGITLQAVRTVLGLATTHIGIERCYIEIADENEPSRALAIRLGATPNHFTYRSDDANLTLRRWKLELQA